ncbi:hypothetical protein B0I35DRAFT_426544 [Stachybotrys elegans]|uniref:Peptidase S1 domain-containing protein n=1 Tax=Stachybotrys elegans TaxID=80388 RepID=A0A8K0SVP4_9HYPO|nr:hypothetical protein B0I35DRAFT_426544 [Stachybotrys elegans]
MEHGTKAWKFGAATGPRFGYYSGFESSISISGTSYLSIPTTDDASYVTAKTFIGSGNNDMLAGPGDSGSVAFDKDGYAVGLIFSGITPQQVIARKTHAFTFVTPIEDVLEDIKALTDVVDIRLAN